MAAQERDELLHLVQELPEDEGRELLAGPAPSRGEDQERVDT
jgi:hypothetical protein